MSSSPVTHENQANTKNGILRVVFVAIAILLEIALIVGILKAHLGNYAGLIAVVIRVLALFLVLFIYSQNRTGSIKIPWIILILLFPPVGVSLYLFIGLSGSTRKMKKRYAEMDAKLMPNLVQDEEVMHALEDQVPSCAGISRYLLNESGYPVYVNTDVIYYDDAAKGIAGNSMPQALAPNQPPSWARRFRSRANLVALQQSCTAMGQRSSAARRIRPRVSSWLEIGER